MLGRPFLVTRRVEGRLVDSSDPYLSTGWLHDASEELQEPAHRRFPRRPRRHPPDRVGAIGVSRAQRRQAGSSAVRSNAGRRISNGPTRAVPHPTLCTRQLRLVHGTAIRPTSRRPRLLWGDAQLANAVFADDGSTAAVLDFELAAVGPAELDLGWFFCLHDMTVARCGQDLPGFADRPRTAGRHTRSASGARSNDLEWYEVFAAVCTASILVRVATLLGNGWSGRQRGWLARTPHSITSPQRLTLSDRGAPAQAAHTNEPSPARPMSGCAPVTMLCRLPQPDPAADRVPNLDHAITELMKARRHLRLGAVGVVLAVQEVLPPPLAVPVPVVAHVEPGTEMEPGVRHRSELERALRARPPSRIRSRPR